jgi:hypothetical protein
MESVLVLRIGESISTLLKLIWYELLSMSVPLLSK